MSCGAYTEGSAMNRDRLVVLLSGGMDSTLAFLIAKARGENVLGLFVDLGQPYANKERKAIESLKKAYADCIETTKPLEGLGLPGMPGQVAA